MKKKISKLQIFKYGIQVLFFILLPGLFTLAFSQLKLIYTMILKGDFDFLQAFPRLVVAFSILPITILFGRFFCGWLCAFGTFNDFVYLISKKVFKTKFKVSEELDSVLKYLKYVVLIFIVALLWTSGNKSFDTSSPWDAFAQISNFPQMLADYTIGFILLVIITVGAAFIERFFCRYLCPLGGVFVILSKLRFVKIHKPTEKCGKCKACTNSCVMGINLYKMESVSSGECISCLNCVEVCPRNNAEVSVIDQSINPALASSIAIVAVTGLYAGNTAIANVIDPSGVAMVSTSSSLTGSNQAKYKDGTYNGVGRGFKPNINVSVTIKNSKITSIEITSENESSGYKEQPIKVIPQEIIAAQSTKVDAISGATRTSNGIMQAVEDALSNASINGVSQSNSTSDTTTSNTTTKNETAPNTAKREEPSHNEAKANIPDEGRKPNNPSTSESVVTDTSKNQYKDGIYAGVGRGFKPNINVSVTVKSGKITNIQIISERESSGYKEEPIKVIPQEIIATQSTRVDAVSGATRTSNGIMSAVENALSKAKK